MHYRVEIQREHGRKLPAPRVAYGQLQSYVRTFGERSVVMLQLLDTGSVHDIPKLYSPAVTRMDHEGMLLSGLESTADGAWVAQSWWCAYSTAEAAMAATESERPAR